MSTFETNNNTTATTTTVPFHYNISHKRRAKTPSFSSILLDAIYRSIDDNSYTDTDSSSSHNIHTPKTVSTTSTLTSTSTTDIKHYESNNNTHIYDYVPTSKHRRTKMRSDSHLETIELRHAIMIDSWIDRQLSPSPHRHRQQSQQHAHYNHNNNVVNCNTNNIRLVRQKSVPSKSNNDLNRKSSMKSTRETSPRIFNKTKLKALKIYNDLRKNKQHNHNQNQQPISPGARFAAFLNSIFRNSGGTPAIKSPENIPVSACSSLSSCLSKTTTTTLEKSKRSVRFYPASVILDEEYTTPCSHTLSCRVNNTRHDNDDRIVDDQKRLSTSASDHQQQQRKWKRDKEIDALIKRNRNRNRSNEFNKEVLKIEIELDEEIMMNVDDEDKDEDEDEDDGESCASSDLFELENLSSIGVTVSRFNQELPVYGTTSFNNFTS